MAGSAVLWSSATAIVADAARIAEENASLVERWRDLGGELWIAAGVAAVVWLAVFAILAAATDPRRIDPGPETLDLGGTEPPAVVNLITRDWRLGREVLPATLLDLAARRHLAIDQVGEQTMVRIKVRRTAESGPRGELTTYETMILDHVGRLSGQAEDGVIPAEALTTGPDSASRGWWRRFEQAVRRDARDRGLARPRWSTWMRLTLAALGLVVGLNVGLATSATWREDDGADTGGDQDDDPVSTGFFAGVTSFGLLMALVGATSRERDTPDGRDAAARWLGLRDLLSTDPLFAEQPPAGVAIWDRHLAYGAGLGVAHGAVRALPLGAERDDEAWSSVGGRWRLVGVRYPTRIPPGFGRHPARVALVGLFQLTVVGYGLTQLPNLPDAANDLVREIGPADWDPALVDTVARSAATVLAVVGGLIVLRAAWMVGAGVIDLGSGRDTIEGKVLRHRIRGSNNSTRWRIAVDDGHSDRIRAWCLYRFGDATQGSTVRARVTRLLAHVKDLETVGAAPAGEPGGPDDPELAMDAAANAELAAALYATAAATTAPLPAPPLPDEATISQAAQLLLQQGPQAAAHPLAVDGGSASFQGPSGAHILVAWTNPVAIAGFSHIPKFLYRRLDGLGDEAYRSRFGGYVAVRQSGHTAVVMTKLPGRSDDERDRVGLAVARVMVATAAQAGGAVGTPNGPLPDEASPDATPGTDHTGKVFGQW